MNRIQNQINAAKAEKEVESALTKAKLLQEQRESDGLHRWVTIRQRNKLRILCRCDKQGTLLPEEVERIRRVKQTLGIKE